jgi:hypothetical protein
MDLYSVRKLPTALAEAPMAMKTREKPRMKSSAFRATARVAPPSPSLSLSTLTPDIREI